MLWVKLKVVWNCSKGISELDYLRKLDLLISLLKVCIVQLFFPFPQKKGVNFPDGVGIKEYSRTWPASDNQAREKRSKGGGGVFELPYPSPIHAWYQGIITPCPLRYEIFYCDWKSEGEKIWKSFPLEAILA